MTRGYTESITGLGRKIAAPSMVVPAQVGKNCTLLEGLVDEVGVLLFETRACLSYDQNDLPGWLPDLELSYHLHLPLDTDWSRDLGAVWAELAGLLDKTAFLSPRALVLHPPPEHLLAPLAERFTAMGMDMDEKPGRVLLENVEDRDLTGILPLAAELGYGFCLDLGHILAYLQHPLVTALDRHGLWDRVGMLHVYAPGPEDAPSRHRGLEHLDGQGRDLLHRMLENTGPDTVLTLEIFDLEALRDSLDLLKEWTNAWRK